MSKTFGDPIASGNKFDSWDGGKNKNAIFVHRGNVLSTKRYNKCIFYEDQPPKDLSKKWILHTHPNIISLTNKTILVCTNNLDMFLSMEDTRFDRKRKFGQKDRNLGENRN